MSFFRPQDKMILMNSNEDMGGYGLPFKSMDTPLLIRMRDECGISIVEEQIYWHDIEKGIGQYDWTLPDKQVKRVRDAGLRLLLCAPVTVPTCLPVDWYWKTKEGYVGYFGLSFWKDEAQQYELEFIKKVIERYSDSETHVIYHGFLGGECIMPNHPSFYDDAALANFRARYGANTAPNYGPPHTPEYPQERSFALDERTTEWLRDAVIKHHLLIQEPFKAQFNEVWDDAQPMIAKQSEANGNSAQYALHKAYTEKWPDVEQWLLMYTYFGNGEWSASEIERLRDDFNCKVIVEANYCEGLWSPPPTVVTAIEKKFQGQIVCPLHPFRGHTEMEPKMMAVIKWANDLWTTPGLLENTPPEIREQWNTIGWTE